MMFSMKASAYAGPVDLCPFRASLRRSLHLPFFTWKLSRSDAEWAVSLVVHAWTKLTVMLQEVILAV